MAKKRKEKTYTQKEIDRQMADHLNTLMMSYFDSVVVAGFRRWLNGIDFEGKKADFDKLKAGLKALEKHVKKYEGS